MLVDDVVSIGEDDVSTAFMLLYAKSVLFVNAAPYNYLRRLDSSTGNSPDINITKPIVNNLYRVFSKQKNSDLLIKQLWNRTYYFLLVNQYDVFTQNVLYISPFGNIENKRVALYGAGVLGREIYRKSRRAFPNRIVLWVDRHFETYVELGFPVQPVEALLTNNFDIVVVALVNKRIAAEVKENLVRMGVGERKIRILNEPSQEDLLKLEELFLPQMKEQ